MVALVTLLALAASPAPPRCPAGRALRRALAVATGDWRMACKVDGEARVLMAGFAPPGPGVTPRLALAVATRGTRPARLQVAASGGDLATAGALGAAEWSAAITTDRLGEQEVIRVGMLARGGDARAFFQEYVAFFRLGADGKPRLLWMGRGDRAETRLDICFLESSASFAVTPDGDLERTTVTRRIVRGAQRDPEAQRLRDECVPAPRQLDRFALPR